MQATTHQLDNKENVKMRKSNVDPPAHTLKFLLKVINLLTLFVLWGFYSNNNVGNNFKSNICRNQYLK